MSPDNRLTFSMAGLLIFWIGSTIVCFGWIAIRNNVFPLCFLFLMVPPPERTVALITEFLQREIRMGECRPVPGCRSTSCPGPESCCRYPGLDIEVAKECGGVRSSAMLILITLILAHLFLRTWPRKTLLVLAAIPSSFVKNGIRIFTIAELGTRVDPGFLDGRLHHDGGIIFLALSGDANRHSAASSSKDRDARCSAEGTQRCAVLRRKIQEKTLLEDLSSALRPNTALVLRGNDWLPSNSQLMFTSGSFPAIGALMLVAYQLVAL